MAKKEKLLRCTTGSYVDGEKADVMTTFRDGF